MALLVTGPDTVSCSRCGLEVEREDAIEVSEEMFCGIYGIVRICTECL